MYVHVAHVHVQILQIHCLVSDFNTVQNLSTVAAPQLENSTVTPEQDNEESQDDQGILNRGMCYQRILKISVMLEYM